MAFDANMERALVQALNVEDVSRDLLDLITAESAAMSLFRTVRMAKNQTRLPVIETLPMAYFVNGDTGLKQTTEMSWSNKYLNVEELATIIPIPEAVLDDSDYDIWGAVKPLAVNAAIRAIDAAIFFNVNRPASWDDAIITGATAIGNVVTRGTKDAAHGSLAGDFSDLFETVESQGYNPSGIIANVSYKSSLRNARDVQGERLDELSPTEVYGIPVTYPLAGLWPTGVSKPEAITGDFSQGILGLRQDFTWKILTEATIQDNTGATIYNFAQQDMIGLRMVFRCAFAVANTINYQQQDKTLRYPFAVMNSPAS